MQNLELKINKELTIRTSNMRSLRRIQFLRWGKRFTSSGSAVRIVNVHRSAPVNSCHRSYFLRQFFWRLRSQWKQALKWQRSSVQYSYDLHSYSQNFDDGCFHDHVSSCAHR